MANVSAFLNRTLGKVLGPDRGRGGLGPAPSGPASNEGAATIRSLAGTAVPDAADHDAADGLDPGVVDVVAAKILLAWLRNRYQLLFPFALDLHGLDDARIELFIRAMILAAQADGSLDGRERERIDGALALLGRSRRPASFVDDALSHPKSLNEVLAQVHDTQGGALVYAASLMAVDGRKPVNRHYLRYLAARLQLSEELAGSLEQRFHAPS